MLFPFSHSLNILMRNFIIEHYKIYLLKKYVYVCLQKLWMTKTILTIIPYNKNIFWLFSLTSINTLVYIISSR